MIQVVEKTLPAIQQSVCKVSRREITRGALLLRSGGRSGRDHPPARNRATAAEGPDRVADVDVPRRSESGPV
jgi:hypothetical protein